MRQPYTLDRTVRLLITVVVLLLLFLLTKRLSSVLLPFLISWFVAYMVHPLVKFFQYRLKLKNRVLSVAVTLLLFFGIVVGVLWLLIPQIVNEFGKLNHVVSVYMSGINADTFIPELWQNEIRQFLGGLDVVTLLNSGDLMHIAQRLLPHVWSVLGGSLTFLAGFAIVFISLLYLVFILIDFEKISNGWEQIIPKRYRALVADITHDLEVGMNRYFRGQALVALSVGVLFAIGFSIINLPLAIVLGLFIGLLNMVPYLQVAGILPSLLLGLLQSAETGTNYLYILIGIAAVFAIVQLIQDIFLVPKIMGNITGMNPAIILLSLSVWGSLLGVAGMIIALPLTTLIISYYKRLVLREGDKVQDFLSPEEE